MTSLSKICIKALITSVVVIICQMNLVGQSIPSNEIKIGNDVVSFSSNCIANQRFQSVESDDFKLMWLYLKHQPGIEGASISKATNGEISYTSGHSLDHISKKGFSVYPKKNEEVIATPADFIVLGEPVSGNILELKGKKGSTYYLVACGSVNGKDMGFQVKLNSKQTDNATLNSDLSKLIRFKE